MLREVAATRMDSHLKEADYVVSSAFRYSFQLTLTLKK